VAEIPITANLFRGSTKIFC